MTRFEIIATTLTDGSMVFDVAAKTPTGELIVYSAYSQPEADRVCNTLNSAIKQDVEAV
jgi:hypothetical protein